MKFLKRKTVKKIIAGIVCISIAFIMCFTSTYTVEAKISKKAKKFLKGTWVTAGNSQSIKVIFTDKHVKYYSLWTDDHSEVKCAKKKGTYLGKSKIVSAKKKGKEWTIKVGKKGNYTYYKGYGEGLMCWFKGSDGELTLSVSDSLQKVYKKTYK